MNKTLRRHVAVAEVGTACVLLAALVAGCTQESEPPGATAAASANDPSQGALVKPGAERPAAAAPKGKQAAQAPAPAPVAKADAKTVQVGACDGGSPVKVPEALTGRGLADTLLDQWKRSHPEANWVAEEKQKHALKPPADNSDLLHGDQAKGDAYGNFTPRDLLTWTRETEKFVAEGSRIFHDTDKISNEIGVPKM